MAVELCELARHLVCMRALSAVAASPDEMKKPLQRGTEVMRSVVHKRPFRLLSLYFYLKQSTCIMQEKNLTHGIDTLLTS